MIIFLNGTINSGKSTIAKILAKELPNTALVEVDPLRDMIGWMPIEKAVPISLENSLLVIKNFSKKDFNVVVPYPLSQDNYDYMMAGLENIDTKVYVFTLAPRLDNALINRGSRELNNQEKERIKYHYSIGLPNPSFGKIIDNSEQSPQQTAEYILANLK